MALIAIMLAVAATSGRVFHPVMDTKSRSKAPLPDAQALGKALKSLRERAGLTQPAAAEQMGVTRQAWGNYEAGRDVVLREDVQNDLAKAIGATREDLLRERERITGAAASPANSHLGGNVYELPVIGRVRATPNGPQIYDDDGAADQHVDLAWIFGATARSVRQAGDDMTGYVESGQLVVYDTTQWPSRGDGCVVELHNGDVYVREYVSTSQGVLTVKQRFPEETTAFPMSDVKGVYKVGFRGG